MTEIRFVTREIGSLAKLGWRVKAIAGRPVEGKEVEEAREWGWRLGIDSGELAEILRKGGSFTNEEKVKIQDFAALYGIRILEHAGLDVVYVVEKPLVERAYDLEEFEFVRAHTDRAVKTPFTGAYTIMDWSYDEHYAKDIMLGAVAQRAEARRRFAVEVARDVVRPNVTGLVEAGAEWVQIDEPAATTRPEEVPLVVETFNATR